MLVEGGRDVPGGLAQLVEADAALAVDEDRQLGPVQLHVDQVQAPRLEDG